MRGLTRMIARRVWPAGVLTLCWLAAAAVGRAGPADVLSVSTSALYVDLDIGLLHGPGYRPIPVTVISPQPAAADRTLSVEFLFREWSHTAYDFRIVRHLDIPAGSGTIKTTLTVPRVSAAENWEILVSLDGVLLRSFPNTYSGQAPWNEAMPAVLFAGNTPDTTRLAKALHVEDPPYRPGGTNTASLASPSGILQGPGLPGAAFLPLVDFPDQWIHYSGFDAVCLSYDDLSWLHAKRPALFEALATWIATGGNLWVYGVGPDWQHAAELEKLLQLPAEPRPKPALHEAFLAWLQKEVKTKSEQVALPAGWTPPDKSLYGRISRAGISQGPGSAARAGTDFDFSIGDTAPPPGRQPAVAAKPTKLKPPPLKAPSKPPFVSRPMQAGLVVAIASDTPFPGTAPDWAWLLDSTGAARWQWYQRHGLSLSRDNPDFWNFLIPGVGLAPVTEFCVLISLFVLAIGPLNYWLLRRRRKLHLLLLTTPLSALALTLLLFGYAMIADGLGVRVRARSVTDIDQHSGRAVCWSRLAYSAGLAPRDGLHFPTDTVVLPLEQAPLDDNGQRAIPRDLVWGDDQHLSTGWLPSRSPRQLVTVRARTTNLGLDLLEPAPGQNQPRVRNRLQSNIDQLLVRDNQGHYLWAEGVPAGAVAALEPISLTLALSHWSSATASDKLQWPPGMEQSSSGGIFGISDRRRSYRDYLVQYGNEGTLRGPTQTTGRLEQMRMPSIDRPLLTPGSYAAMVQQSPEVVFGVPSPRVDASSHVILGKW